MNRLLRTLSSRWIATALFVAGCLPALAQSPSQGMLLVVTKQAHALAIVDGATLEVLAKVPIGEDPHEVVVGPDGRTALRFQQRRRAPCTRLRWSTSSIASPCPQST